MRLQLQAQLLHEVAPRLRNRRKQRHRAQLVRHRLRVQRHDLIAGARRHRLCVVCTHGLDEALQLTPGTHIGQLRHPLPRGVLGPIKRRNHRRRVLLSSLASQPSHHIGRCCRLAVIYRRLPLGLRGHWRRRRWLLVRQRLRLELLAVR